MSVEDDEAWRTGTAEMSEDDEAWLTGAAGMSDEEEDEEP